LNSDLERTHPSNLSCQALFEYISKYNIYILCVCMFKVDFR